MSRCLICSNELKDASKYTNYHDKCLITMFGSIKVNPIIDVNLAEFKSEYISEHRDCIRMSISGVQLKKLAKLEDNRVIGTAKGGLYIIKPSPEEFTDLAIAEHLNMLMAQSSGIKIPPVGLFRLNDQSLVYMIKRFDKDMNGAQILHQEDMTSIMQPISGKVTIDKYSTSYEEVLESISDATDQKLLVLYETIKRVIFSYFTLNGDMHLKNISLIKGRISISYSDTSPGYDFVPSSLYIPGEDALALDLFKDDEFSEEYEALGYFTRYDFIQLAHRLKLQSKPIEKYIKALIKLYPTFQQMIKESLLSDDLKEKYLALLQRRFNALSYTK